jgi:hypothetical protein
LYVSHLPKGFKDPLRKTVFKITLYQSVLHILFAGQSVSVPCGKQSVSAHVTNIPSTEQLVRIPGKKNQSPNNPCAKDSVNIRFVNGL